MACPAAEASKLLNGEIESPDEFESILNIHFKINTKNISKGIYGVLPPSPVDWIFVKEGLISTTTSAYRNFDNIDDVKSKIWEIVQKTLNISEDPQKTKVINEKKATFSCTNSQVSKRPQAKSKYENLLIAGEFTDTNLPSTIEGAAISGKTAASLASF